jgi:hypothetical protein
MSNLLGADAHLPWPGALCLVCANLNQSNGLYLGRPEIILNDAAQIKMK